MFFERGLHATSICGAVGTAVAVATPVDEELARKFHDNAVRFLPEERAAEFATGRSPFLTLRAARISPRC